MKKRIFYILCLFLTLSVGKTIAAPSPEKEVNSTAMMYSVNLGDITGLSEESVDAMLAETFSNVPDCADEMRCTATITVTITCGTTVAEVSVTIEAPCSEIVKEAKKVLAMMKMDLG